MRNFKKLRYALTATVALGAVLLCPRTAFAATKELPVNLSHECIDAMFYVTCAKDTEHNYTYQLISPDGQSYGMTVGDDGTASAFMNTAKEGTWKVSVSDNDATNKDVDSTIGELTVSVKENVGSGDTVDDDEESVAVKKQLSGLKMYLKDDSVVISWSDETIDAVNVEVADTKTQQKYFNDQVIDELPLIVDFPSETKQITVTLTPSTDSYDSSSSQSYTLDIDNHPDATITFDGSANTNSSELPFHAVLGEGYTLVYEDNGQQVGTSGALEAGEYDLSVPLMEGENDVSVYVQDADGDMRSTSYTTTLDSTAPVLQIKTNYDGGSTTADSITFEGSVSGCDKLTVNNEEVTPDYDGAFSYTASLNAGQNRFQIAASDNAGNISTYEATITRIEEQQNSSAVVSAGTIQAIALVLLVALFVFLFTKYKKFKNDNDDGDSGSGRGATKGKKNSSKTRQPSEAEQKLQRDELIHTILSIAIPLFIVVFVFRYLLLISIVQSGSMEPTIMAGDFTMASTLSYQSEEPQRGDIVFVQGKQTNGEIYLKRIVGMPGDHIEFHDGYVYINDQLVQEEYLAEDVQTNCNRTFDVPEGCYFVMGDNRENSADARYWTNPYLTRDEILGKVVVSFTIPGNRKVTTLDTTATSNAVGAGTASTEAISAGSSVSDSADATSTNASNAGTADASMAGATETAVVADTEVVASTE